MRRRREGEEEERTQKPKTTEKKADNVEVLVKKIEMNGAEGVEKETPTGEKRQRVEGGTPEDQKRASKISMGKIGGGSKIAQPTIQQNLIK